jgi:hypothetical protein
MNAGEREAVVDKRRVIVDALRRNMSFTTYDAVIKELNERIESGEFIRLMRNGSMEDLTTSQTVAMERSNLERVVAGRGTQEPILEPERSGRIVQEITARQGITLNDSQREAVATLLESRDRIVGLQGRAGTGKTTALAVLREAAERQGYEIEGFAPTGAAADLLAEWDKDVDLAEVCGKHPDGVRYWKEDSLRDGRILAVGHSKYVSLFQESGSSGAPIVSG